MAEAIIIDADDDAYSNVEVQDTESVITEDENPPGGTDDQGAEGDEIEVEVEGKGTEVQTEDSELQQLRKRTRELETALLEAVKQPRQQQQQVAPKQEPKEEKVTKAQMVQILNEHRDADGNFRPDVLMNIVDHLVDEKTKEVKTKAFEELSQSNWEREVAGVSNRVLSEDPILAANPQLNDEIDRIVSNLRLGDHPAGRLAAYALIQYGKGGQKEVKEAVPEDKKKSAAVMDKTRKGVIVPSADKTSSKKVTLTSEQLQMAKRFGVKPETYAKFVKKGA